MTIDELMSATGLSYLSIHRRITRKRTRPDGGEFLVPGFGKFHASKSGHAWDIRRVEASPHKAPTPEEPVQESPAPPPETSDSPDSLPKAKTLREAKLVAEIKKLTQQLEEGRSTILEKGREEWLDMTLKLLAPIPEAFRQCKLTAQQAELIGGAFNRSLESLKQSLGA